jgi:hypothetical protein
MYTNRMSEYYEGKPHGIGHITYPSAASVPTSPESFSSAVTATTRTSSGMVLVEYSGEMKAEGSVGWGRITYSNGLLYEGECVDTLKHGHVRSIPSTFTGLLLLICYCRDVF